MQHHAFYQRRRHRCHIAGAAATVPDTRYPGASRLLAIALPAAQRAGQAIARRGREPCLPDQGNADGPPGVEHRLATPFIRRYVEATAAFSDQLPVLLDEYGIAWTFARPSAGLAAALRRRDRRGPCARGQ